MRKEDVERFQKIIDKLQGKEQKNKYEYMALCPVHGDARLSLWVKLEETGRIALYCHANCPPHSICKKLGFQTSILYPVPQIIDIFDYITTDGQLLYQEVKYDKTALNRFKARRPIDKKKSADPWEWNIKGVPRILYNLFEVVNAKDDDIVFMCEGAKDARTLLRKGFISTAAIFNDWIGTDTSPLNNKPVIILVDNDEAGETKALKAAHDRRNKSTSIKLLRLPGLNKGGDVTDWFEKGGINTKEKFWELATSENLKDWYPKESIRDRIENGLDTGIAFEHNFPRPIFLEWLEIFHPPEEGPLYFWDDMWLKGDPKTLLFKEVSKNSLLEQIEQLLLHCSNRHSKNAEEPFKPTPAIRKMILDNGETFCDLDILRHPTLPIFMEQ